MMKYLLFLLSIFTYGFSISYEVDCIGSKKETNLIDLDYTFSGEFITDSTVGGHLDTCNFGMTFWDINSPICGGNGTQNIMKELYNLDCDDDSYTFTVNDTSGTQTYIYDSYTNTYQNNTIFVNGFPCLSSDTNSLSVGYSNADTNENIGFVSAHGLSVWGDILTYDVSLEAKKVQKDICSNNPYDELEPQAIEQNILFNENTNTLNNIGLAVDTSDTTYQSILTAFNNLSINNSSDNTTNTTNEDSLNNISNSDLSINDTNLNNAMNSFTTEYTNIIDTSFINFSDVFGFGGYGSAPDTISFNLLGNSYDVFNAKNFDPFIDTFRNTFASFAYVWGFLIVLKDFKE